MFITKIYFEIAKEANMAQDGNGQPEACGAEFSMEHEKPFESEQERKEFVDKVRNYIAYSAEIDRAYIQEVTEEYYNEHYNEDFEPERGPKS